MHGGCVPRRALLSGCSDKSMRHSHEGGFHMDAPLNNAIAPGGRVTRRFGGEFRVPARQSGTRCMRSPHDILHIYAAGRHERVDLDKQRVPSARFQTNGRLRFSALGMQSVALVCSCAYDISIVVIIESVCQTCFSIKTQGQCAPPRQSLRLWSFGCGSRLHKSMLPTSQAEKSMTSMPPVTSPCSSHLWTFSF